SSLYSSRQRYENSLSSSAALSAASANLAAAGVAEEEVLRDAHGPSAHTARSAAAAQYKAAASAASALVGGDRPSARLLAGEIAAERKARALAARGGFVLASAARGPLAQARTFAAQVQARQQVRQRSARSKARSDSRKALVLIIVAGLLAVIGGLALVTLLIGAMREPLDALVSATRR